MTCAEIFDLIKVVCEFENWPDLFLAALTLYPLLLHAVCLICFVSSDRASQPSPFVNTPTGALALSGVVSGYDLSSETCFSLCRPS